MDPQQTPPNQPNQPAPTAVPTTPPLPGAPMPQQVPQVVPEVVQPLPPTSPAPFSPVPPAKSSKKLLIIIIAVVIVVVAALAAAWFLYFSPAAQSKRLSNNFMHSITTGDVAKATDLTGDATAKTFLTTASKSVNGSYKMSQSKFTDGKGYYLYTLSGADKKYARTIVEKDKDKGKRVVDSFVFSTSALALVPSAASASDSDSNSATASSSSSSTASDSSAKTGCLTPADFSFFANVDMDTPLGQDGVYSAFFQLEFNPDVATYAADDNPDPTTVYNDIKNFYAQDSSKKFNIQLESSVNSATPDVALANARNAKVQSDLETISGVPAARITLEPVSNENPENNGGDAFNRQVQIMIVSDTSCSTM